MWGIVVQSLERDERLFELNSRALLASASVAKLSSLATTVDAVRWDYRFETTLRATGPIVDGVLQGDLVVVGSGDPSIGGRSGGEVGSKIQTPMAIVILCGLTTSTLLNMFVVSTLYLKYGGVPAGADDTSGRTA